MQRIIALLLLAAISPFLFILYLLVKLTSKGPFVFKQKRIGKNFQPFFIYKVRTMVDEAEKLKEKFAHLNEADGPVFKIKNDPRFTTFGKMLAYTGFDEILQLINIIKGEMSFVGPRPLPIDEAAKIVRKYKTRFLVKPGITSPWVITGAHNLSFTQWMESDLEYVRKRSIISDIEIFLITILSIIKWSGTNIFLLFYPWVLVFFAISPDSIWWFQIFTFLSVLLFLSLNFTRPLPKSYIFLASLLLISTFFSVNKISSVPYLFSYLLAFFLASTFIEYQKETLLKSFVAATFIMGILSTLYTAFRLLSLDIPSVIKFLDVSTNLIIPYYGYAFYGVFLIATLPFVLEKATNEEKPGIWSFVSICFSIFLLLTFSKAAIFVGMLEIGIVAYLNKQKTAPIKRVFSPVIIISSIFVLSLIIAIPKNPWLREKIFKPSVSARMEYLSQNVRVLQNMSRERLFTGYGLDNFFELSNMYQGRPGMLTKSSHNFFVQFLIENGVVAVSFLIFFIIYSFFKNFRNYSLAHKVILLSILIYSQGSIYDLNTIPILMLFFILLIKPAKKKISAPPPSGIWFIIIAGFFLVWTGYLINYSSLFLFNKQDIQVINLFPYDSAFWTILADNNAGRADQLVALKNKLAQYSRLNADLNKYIIRKIFQSGDYCEATSDAQNYLKLVPYDTDAQNIFMQSIVRCMTVKTDQITAFFHTIKPHYEIAASYLSETRNFLQFIAAYYYNHGYTDESQFWQTKAWQVDLENNTDNWYGVTYNKPGQEILIVEPFKISMKLASDSTLSSGINLYGRLDDIKLFIGVADKGEVLYVDVSDKTLTTPIKLFDSRLKNNDKSVSFIFSEDGTRFEIFDSSGNSLGKVDIIKITGNRFPRGIFPDKKLYLGYGAAPKSSLTIRKLIIKE